MRRRLLLPFLLALPSCASAAAERSYSWVWILTGPNDAAVQGEARQAAFAGHFANMQRLSEDGSLLVAGPLAEPRARPDHRGIFVVAAGDLAAAREIAGTDPAARAGIFVLEVEPFLTSAPLDLVPERHKAFVAASGVADPPMDFHCRSYVMLTGAPAAAAEAALRGAPEVLAAGRFPARDAAHFWLDFATADEARGFLDRRRAPGVAWTLIPWYGSAELAGLAATR